MNAQPPVGIVKGPPASSAAVTSMPATTVPIPRPRTDLASDADTNGSVAITPAEIATFPLSFAQERLWYLAHLEGQSAAYNIAQAWHLSGVLRRDALERSIHLVVQRHDALRTTIHPGGGASQPVQVVHANPHVPLEWTDLTHLPFSEANLESERRASAIAREPFDLVTGPLMRAHVFQLGAEAHLLLFVVHHIVFDAASMSVLEHELVTAYRDHVGGRPLSLPLVVAQMGEYAAEQRRILAAGGFESQLAFWRRYLDGAFPASEVRADFDPKAAAVTPAGSVGRDIPSDLASRVLTLARAERTTIFHVFVAAWSLVLSRHSDHPDIIIGTPVANREQAEFEAMVGFLVNTLPLRVRLETGASVRATLRRVRDSVLEAVTHADVPLDRLVQEVGPPRATGRGPLFQSLIAFEPGMPGQESFNDLDWFQVNLGSGVAKFDLTLWITEAEDGLRATLDYATDRFGSTRMDRMIGHFLRALEQMVANPDAMIADLDILSETERAQLLLEWNHTSVPYPRDARVEELFQKQVGSTPDAVALVCGGVQLTYAELDQRSNQLARYLGGLGVAPGIFVVLHLERSMDFVISVLAVLKAGAAYVPLDVDLPADRLAFCLEDTRAPVIITRGSGLRTTGVSRIVDLREAATEIADCATKATDPAGRAEHPACVMYTSGSSGKPKGVVVPHRGIVRLVRGQNYAEFTPGQRFMLLASPAFDASTFELWGPLLNGATCVIFSDRWPDLSRLEHCIRQERASCLWLTASLFNLIIDRRPGLLGTVDHVMVGGESLSLPHVQRAFAALPFLRLTNGYGPTESTTFACTHAIPRDMRFACASVPIGRPIANTHCYILDAHGRLAPAGSPGEIHLGGDGLATDYLNLPDLTAERFVIGSFSDAPGARLYRTGDRGRWLADGTIEFLGRLDDQVKLRGFRIELGEIERALAQDPLVAQAAVAVRQDAGGDAELVAFVVPRAGTELCADELRRELGSRLPDFMVPARFRIVDRLPLNANGKVDRRALLRENHRDLPSATEHIEPRTPAEATLATIWQRVLHRERVGVHDNFFQLGGSSLVALRLVHEINQDLARSLRLAEFIAAPTIARLAQRLDSCGSGDSTAAPPILRGTGSGTPLFCIPSDAGCEVLAPAVARRLESDRPITDGLQFQGIDGREPPLDRVEDIAASLIRKMRSVCPSGPYSLSGFCFGGLVAYEMARQLTAVGETVKAVAMWDSLPRVPWRRRKISEVLALLHRQLKTSSPAGRRQFVGRLFRSALHVVRAAIKHALRPESIPEHATRAGLSDAEREVIKASYRAIDQYRPEPYAGRVLLLRSERKIKESLVYEAPRLDGWDGLLRGPVNVVDFACLHHDLRREPIVSQLAENMAAFLREADRDPPDSRAGSGG